MNIELSEREANDLRAGVLPISVQRKVMKPWQYGRLASSLILVPGNIDAKNTVFVHLKGHHDREKNNYGALVAFVREGTSHLSLRVWRDAHSGNHEDIDLTTRANANS